MKITSYKQLRDGEYYRIKKFDIWHERVRLYKDGNGDFWTHDFITMSVWFRDNSDSSAQEIHSYEGIYAVKPGDRIYRTFGSRVRGFQTFSYEVVDCLVNSFSHIDAGGDIIWWTYEHAEALGFGIVGAEKSETIDVLGKTYNKADVEKALEDVEAVE